MQEELAGWLANKTLVFHRHCLHSHKGMTNQLIRAGLKQIKATPVGVSVHQVNFKKIIGCDIGVETETDGGRDEIVYAVRLDSSGRRRSGHTRFVKNLKPQPTTLATFVILNKDDVNILLTAFVGAKSEPEPWDNRADQNSLEFWQRHALVFGFESIDQTSITEVCPWDQVKLCALA